MKAFNSNALIVSLQADIRDIIVRASKLEREQHNMEKCPATGSWSVAQVLEHLNIYARFYIGSIESKLHMHQTSAGETFNPGWLGNYFTNMMKPGADNTIAKKMKSPKEAVPVSEPDTKTMLQEFLAHQHHLLNLLQVAQSANLETIRIPTFLSRFISLKLGDMFRFLVAHEQRHFVQISNTLAALKDIPGKRP